jgi:hypothetical protein
VPFFSFQLYDPIHHSDKKIDVPQNSVGLLANALGADILIAYPIKPGSAVPTLDALMKLGDFYVIRVNWETFRRQFAIEI